jgi:hypothetical protein
MKKLVTQKEMKKMAKRIEHKDAVQDKKMMGNKPMKKMKGDKY